MATDSNGLDINDDERAIIENYRKLPEKRKKLLSDYLSSPKNVNDIDSLNCLNISGNNNRQTSATLRNMNDTFDDKLIETNSLDDTSQMNQTECKYLLNVLHKNNVEHANLNTQDENFLINIAKKNLKHILNSIKDEIEINTQQFIDLNACKVAQQLQISEPPHSDVLEIQTIELLDSNDLVISPSTLTNESKRNNKSLEKCNSPCSTVDLNLSYQDPKLSGQDQDSEINTFRAMCEKLKKIQTIDDDVNDKSKIITMNNQVKLLDFKKVNADVLSCISYGKSVPSTSKLNSAVDDNFPETTDDILKRLTSKRHKCSNVLLNVSDENSFEYPTDLSQKYPNFQYKKSTFTHSKNKSKIHSDKIVTKFNTLRKINLINELSSEDEDDCKNIKRKLPKVTNRKTNSHHKKMKLNNSPQQQNFTETTQVFSVSSRGFIHEDMLEYIKSKNNV